MSRLPGGGVPRGWGVVLVVVWGTAKPTRGEQVCGRRGEWPGTILLAVVTWDWGRGTNRWG